MSSREAYEDSETASELDTVGTVPTWLKGELAEAPIFGQAPATAAEDGGNLLC